MWHSARNALSSSWLQYDELKLSKVHVLRKRQGVQTSYATRCRYAMNEFGFGLRTPTVCADAPDRNRRSTSV